MDDVDRAELERDMFLTVALHGLRRRVEPHAPLDEPVHCEECEIEIPLERRKLVPSATRCTTCQDLMEKQGKQYA